jgi:hypothetical protein
LAERAGFEPAVRLSPYTRFPGVRLKPLIHLSGRADFNTSIWGFTHSPCDESMRCASYGVPPVLIKRPVTPAEGIAKFGFRRWYERELIDGHVYLVTCILSLMLTAACLEQINWRGSLVQFVFTLSALALGAALCAGSLRRYAFLLVRAECFGEQSSCGKCSTYGVLNVIGAGVGKGRVSVLHPADNSWIRVQCKKCGHEWRIDNQ